MFNRLTGAFELLHPDLDGLDAPELAEIVARVEKYGEDYQATAQRVRELSDSRREAERKDTEAYAEAIQSGRKDPGTPHADELERQIRDATRRRDALKVALQGLAPEFLAVVEEGREGWLRQAQDGLSTADERLEEARREIQRAEAEAARHRELIAWLENPQNYRPGRASKPRQEPRTAPPPTISVMGGRQGRREGSGSAVRVVRGGAA